MFSLKLLYWVLPISGDQEGPDGAGLHGETGGPSQPQNQDHQPRERTGQGARAQSLPGALGVCGAEGSLIRLYQDVRRDGGAPSSGTGHSGKPTGARGVGS